MKFSDIWPHVAAVASGAGLPLFDLLWGPVLIDQQFLTLLGKVGLVFGPVAAIAASMHAELRNLNNDRLATRLVLWATIAGILVLVCVFARDWLVLASQKWHFQLLLHLWKIAYVLVWVAVGAFLGLFFVAIQRAILR